MVSGFCEVDAVKGKFNIPRPGIHKGNIQLLGQKLIFLCKADGFSHKAICRNPGTPLHERRCDQHFRTGKGLQKPLHPGSCFPDGGSLQQVIGAQHHKNPISLPILRQQGSRAGDFPAVGAGIDAFVTGLFRQQVNPTIICTIAVTKESSGIVTVCIGIAETQQPHRRHLHTQE